MPQQLTRSQLNLLQQRRDELPPEWQATVDKLSRVNNAPTVDRSAAYETFNSAILTKDIGRRNAVMTDTLREATGLLDADTKRLAAHLGYKDEEELASAFGNWIEPYSRTDPVTGEARARFINEAGESPSRLDMLKIDLAGQLPGGMTSSQRSAELTEKRKNEAAMEISMKHFVQTADVLRRQLSPETSRALDALSLAKEIQTRVDGFLSIAQDLDPDEFAAAYQYLTIHIPEIDQKKWRSSFMRGVESMGQNIKTAVQLSGQDRISPTRPMGMYRALQLDAEQYFKDGEFVDEDAKAALRERLMSEVSAKSYEAYGVHISKEGAATFVDAILDRAPEIYAEGARLDQEFLDKKQYYDAFRARVEKSGSFLGNSFNEFLEMAPHTLAVGALGVTGNLPAALLLSYSQIQTEMELHYRRAGMSARGAHLYSSLLSPLAVSLDYIGARAATRGTAGAVQKAFANGLKDEILPLMGVVLRTKGVDYVEEVLTEGGQKLIEDIALVYADRYAHIEGLTTGQLFDDVLDETVAAMRSMWWMTAGPAARDVAGGALYQGLKKAVPTKWYFDLQSEIQQRRNEAAEQAANSEPFFVPDTEGETWAVPPRTAVRYTLAKSEDEKYSIIKEVMESNTGMTEQQAREVLANIEENGGDFAAQYEARVNSILADMGVRGTDQGTPVGRERSKGVTTAIEEVLSRLEKMFASGKNVTVRTHSTVEQALEDPDIDEQTKQRLRNGEGVQAFENNGTVVFISENMDSRGEAIAKFAHEVLGHGSITDISSDKSIDAFLQVLDRLGIREERIKAMYDFLVGLSSAYKGQLAKKVNGVYVDENGNEVAGPDEAAVDERAVADELIARISEKMMNEETLDIEEKRVAEKLRDWLGRNLGFQTPLEWANQEVGTIVRNLMRGDVDGARQQTRGPRFAVAPVIDSEEFKTWFGNSQVVNEDGTPKVMYHGSAADVEVFKGRRGVAVHVTEDLAFAERFADTAANRFGARAARAGQTVFPLYVKVENPFDFKNQDHVQRLHDHLVDLTFSDLQGLRAGEWQTLEDPQIQQAMKDLGFDGYYEIEKGQRNLAVFNPENVKSAIGNIGTFDPGNPDIRYSAGRDLSGDIGTGRGYTDFFGNFHEAKGDEWFFPHGEYQPAINLDTDADAFQRIRGKYRGNFDLHIATSIPGFSDLQAIVGDALVKAYGEQGARVLDIGASEGALVKAMAELTGGRISSIALDPNPKMKATFDEKGRVDGVEYRLEALGDNDVRGKYAWSEIDKNTGIATQIKFFDPGSEKFDVIHEAMVFQFLSNQRASQLDIVKSMLAPDGVVVLEEKFAQADVDQYNANEDKKDYDWKSKYYTEEQIERKRKEVLEKGGDTIEGMTKMQVTVEEMHELLAERFNHFAQFWDSGNFMGFIASDSDVALKNVLDNMQDTSSEYSNNPVGEIYSASRYSIEETRKAQAVHELQVLQVPLRTDGKLQLTHWSPVAGLTSLEPAEFGTGPVFGQERRRAGEGFVNRVQFGLAGYRREVAPGHRYMASVEPGDLYPLLRDPLNLREQAPPVLGQKGDGTPILGSGVDLNRYEQLIQEAGYKGFISQSQFGPVAALFESVPVESVVENDTTSYAPVEVDAQGQDALRSWNYLQNLGYMGGLIFRRAGSPAGMENNNIPRYSVGDRVFYHGSPYVIDKLQEGRVPGIAGFFTASPAHASVYSDYQPEYEEDPVAPNITPVKLHIRNAADLTPLQQTREAAETPVSVDDLFLALGKGLSEEEAALLVADGYAGFEQAPWEWVINDAHGTLVSILKDRGYDAIRQLETNYRGVEKGKYEQVETFAVFEGSNVESAYYPGYRYSVVPRTVDALGFYSPIRAEVEAMDFKQIPPRQLADRIRKLPKQEEMEDLGLYDWLELQDGKVTKEAVLAFIDQGGVQLNQIVNSEEEAAAQTPEFDFGSIVQDEHDDDFIREVAEENLDQFIEDNDLQDDIDEGVLTREEALEQAMEEERINRSDDLGYSREVEVGLGGKTFTFLWNWSPFDGHELYSKDFQEEVIEGQYQQGYMDNPVAEQLIRRFLEDKGEITEEDANEPQYANYVMEGDSSNYREFILTLPRRAETFGLETLLAKLDRGEDLTEAEQAEWRALATGGSMRENEARLTGEFTHPHWPGIQNPLVHFRTTDRRVDGKPTLFLEEIQSDWIQQGRKKGFKGLTAEDEVRLAEINARLKELNDIRIANGGGDLKQPYLDEATSLMEAERAIRNKDRVGVPDPGAFKRSGTVDILAFKRALAIAVAEGYDNIAWTPAVEQIRRWSDSLQQEVRSISWSPGDPNADARLEELRTNIASWQETLKETRQARELAFRMDDARGMTANDVTIERLITAITEAKIDIDKLKKVRTQPAVLVETINAYNPDMTLYYDEQGVITGYENAGGRGDQLLGKNLSEVFDNSIAKQILSSPEGELRENGLTIGGKGFKDFYDGLLPREVQKYVKKMGGRVGVGKAAIVKNPVTHIHTNIDGEYEVIDLGSSRVLATKPSYAEAENWVSENIGPSYAQNEEVWNVEITDAMRDEVSMGQPRYSIRNGGQQGEILEGVQIDETKWRRASDTRYAFASIEGVDDPPFINLSDLNGLEKFVFASDRTKVGPYTPINPDSKINIMLQGGPAFPFAADNQGKAAWAVSAGSQPAKGFDKRVGQVGLITLYNRDNAVKNPTFASVYMAEVQEAIDRGELSKTRFLRVANQLRVAAKRMKNQSGKSIVTGKWAELWRLNWTSLEEMEFALRAAPFDVRSKAFFSPVGKVGGRGFNKIGRNDLVKAGFPDMNLILDGFVDHNLDHMPHGTIVGAVEVGGVSAPHTEYGVPAHDSYSAIIPGRGIGLLRQPVALSEVVDDEAGRQGWLHTRTHTGRMSPANDVQYSIRERRDPLTEATVDMATRILEGKNLNRRQAEMIVNRYYKGADVNKAIYRAHKLAAELKNEWPELEDSWDRAVARVRAAEQALGYAERAQEAYDSISTEFKAKYLQGRLDKTLSDNAARRSEKTLAREKAMKATDLDEQDLLISDPVVQLDVKEELKKVVERKQQEEDAGVEPEQNPEVSDAEIEQTVVTPKAIPQYLSDLKKAVAKHSGFEQGSAEFLVVYRQTLINALDSSVRALTYGRTRESLLRHLGALNDLKTEQGLDRRAASILWNAFQQGARDGRKEAVSKFQKVFRRRLKNKTRNKTGSWTRDALDKTKARMFKFMLDVSRLKPDEVREMQEDLQTELVNGLGKFYALEKDKRGLVADEIADLQMKLELLDRYGALSYKSLAQINDAVDTALNDLDAAFEKQKKRIDERKDVIQARKDLIIQALMSAKGKVKRTELAERIEASLSIYPMSLHSLLQDMIRFASPKLHAKLWNDDVRAEGQVWSLKQLSKEILTKQARIRERKRRVHQELIGAIQQIYGVKGRLKAQAKIAQLMKANENYRKYSKHKNPIALSKADLMQMVAYLEQEFYADNAERHGRMQDYEAIRNELSDQDYALIEWMREFYRGTRQELSDKKRTLTGLGFPVEVDENYMPVSIQQYGSFRGVNTSLQLTPGIYADRRHHTKDITEGQDVFTLFFDRNHKNAVYLELAELSLDIAEIFGDAELQQAMSEVYGERYTKHVLRMLFDTMSQKPLRYGTDGATNALLNYGAIVMTFNLASASRQPASAWEFGLDLKDLNLSKGEIKALKERAGKQKLVPFIVELFRSEHAAARFDAGQSYEIAAAFESEGMSALKTWVNKWGMAPNKMMDLVTIATFGARTYRLYYQHMLDMGMGEEQARQAALEWTWAEAETHQQSGFISNQAPWQRSGDALQKLAGMFSSTPQQFLSIQNQLYRQARATGNWKPFIRSAIIHHVLGPGTYKAIDTLFQLALGRPPDEDEWKEWLAFMVLGPYSGGFVYRMILAYGIDKIIGNKSGVFGVDLIPAERGIEVMGDFIDMLKALLVEGDVDKALGEGDDILSTFQPYNYASTVKENYFDQ